MCLPKHRAITVRAPRAFPSCLRLSQSGDSLKTQPRSYHLLVTIGTPSSIPHCPSTYLYHQHGCLFKSRGKLDMMGNAILLTIAGPWNKSNNGKIHNGSQTCLSGLLDEGWMPEWCKHELLMGVGRWRSMRLASTVFMCSFPLQVPNVAKKLLELRLVNRLA